MVSTRLDELAGAFVTTIVAAVQREYPNAIGHRMDDADDRPTPRQLHPAFYGCYDWHSAVHMHWSLVRLLRVCPDSVTDEAREVLDAHLSADRLAIEAAYLADRPGFSRPYGWGWALTLAAEIVDLDADGNADARRWVDAIVPLADTVSTGFQRFLPRAEFPTRFGMHPNSAFALARSWRWARRDPALRDTIETAARRWFADDRDYPAAWEPSGADFLSGALTEAELMSLVLSPTDFAAWFERFLPAIPVSLLAPVGVTDAADGQLAHLHGLNLSRAHGLRVVSTALGGAPHLERAADTLVAASIDHVVGDDWMVEHWLASFAILAMSGG